MKITPSVLLHSMSGGSGGTFVSRRKTGLVVRRSPIMVAPPTAPMVAHRAGVGMITSLYRNFTAAHKLAIRTAVTTPDMPGYQLWLAAAIADFAATGRVIGEPAALPPPALTGPATYTACFATYLYFNIPSPEPLDIARLLFYVAHDPGTTPPTAIYNLTAATSGFNEENQVVYGELPFLRPVNAIRLWLAILAADGASVTPLLDASFAVD